MEKFALVAFLCLVTAAYTQEIKPVLAASMKSPGPDILTTMLEFIFPAGNAGFPPHINSGPSVFYVVAGEFLTQAKSEPIQVVSAGSAVFLKEGDIHVWSGNANNNSVCRVVGTIFGVAGQPPYTILGDVARDDYATALQQATENS